MAIFYNKKPKIPMKDASTQTIVNTKEASTQTEQLTIFKRLSTPIQTLLDLNDLIIKHKDLVENRLSKEIDILLKQKEQIEEECNHKRQQILNEELLAIHTKRQCVDRMLDINLIERQ